MISQCVSFCWTILISSVQHTLRATYLESIESIIPWEIHTLIATIRTTCAASARTLKSFTDIWWSYVWHNDDNTDGMTWIEPTKCPGMFARDKSWVGVVVPYITTYIHYVPITWKHDVWHIHSCLTLIVAVPIIDMCLHLLFCVCDIHIIIIVVSAMPPRPMEADHRVCLQGLYFATSGADSRNCCAMLCVKLCLCCLAHPQKNTYIGIIISQFIWLSKL